MQSKRRIFRMPIFGRRTGGWMAACVLFVAFAAHGQYDLSWNTIDGGGATSTGGGATSTGGGFTLSGTIGQPDASAVLTGGGYSLTGGFWTVIYPFCTSFVAPDFDQDCDVDINDLVAFEACATGPGVPQANPQCADMRLDTDDDVDQEDFGVFQRCYSGENNPADPNCAG